MWRRLIPIVAIIAVFSFTMGCSDDKSPTSGDGGNGGNGGGNETVLFSTSVLPILTTNCAVSGCHDATTAQEDMVLTAGNAYSSIVNVTSNQNPSLKRVSPGDPNNSYLVKKLEGTGSGDRMPRGRPALPSSQINLIRDWIEQGALNN